MNYCDPSLIPDHDSLDPKDALANTKNAMKLAEQKLGIPQIITPEDLTGERPDERSVMVYLSYFVREGSPGQKRLLEWIHEKIPEQKIADLSSAWVNGKALGALTNALSGGEYKAYEEFQSDASVENCKQAMEAAENLLGVDQTLKPEEFADPEFNVVIRSTYLTQFLYSTSYPKVVNMHTPENAGSSSTPFIDIVCPEGITGEVEAYAKSSIMGKIQATVESTGDNQYRVSFVAEHPEIYTLTVSVGSKRVKGSPFSFNLTPPDPNAVKHVNTILPKKAGIPALLLFDLADAGKGELTCNVTGETGTEVLNSSEQMSPTSCKVSFFPWENGVYNVDVNFNGQPVKGSPFSVNIINLLQPENALVGKPEATKAGEPVIIPLDVSKAGEASLVVKCVGEKAGEVETILLTIDGQEKPTGVSFTPPIEDVYTVSIVFGNTEIEGSPIIVDLCPPPPDPKKVRLVKPPTGALDAGQVIIIGFDTSKAGKGEIKAVCMGKKTGELEVEVKEVSENIYDVSFTPPSTDDYSLEVTWDGEPVSGSPFTLNLVPKDHPNPDNVKVDGFPNPNDLLVVDDEISFQIDTTDAGKGVLQVFVESEAPPKKAEENGQAQQAQEDTGEKEDVKEDETDGKVKDGEQKDESEAKGERDSEAVAEPSPPPPPPPPTLPQEQEQQKQSGEQEQPEQQDKPESTEAKSASPPPGSPEPTTVTPPSGSTTPEPKEPVVEQSKDNPKIYNVSYKLSHGGPHTMKILWAGEPVPSFPITFDVIQPRMAEFGSPIKIELKTNYKRKHLKVQAVSRNGGKEHKVRMDKIASGHYILIFHPNEPGLYLLHVATKEGKLEDSPYIINYSKTIKPEEVKVTGLGEQGYVGEPISFTIDAKHAGSTDVSVFRQPHGSILSLDSALTQGGDVISLNIKLNEDGTYSAIYTPTTAGEENVDVRIGGVPIPGSPFPVSILKRDEESSTPTAEQPKGASGGEKKNKKSKANVSGFGLENERFLVGNTQKFKLHCEELGEGKLDVTCKPQSAAEIDVTTTTGENSYWVEITPKKAGKHEIIVRYGGKHILGSPFRVQFLSRGDALKCHMVDPLPDCPKEIEDEVIFCFSTKGAGKGKLRATAKSISTEKEVPVTITQAQKNHYHLQLAPTEGLNYTLIVLYDELHIQGSPFRIALGDASRCHTSGDGLFKAWSMKWNKFTIDSEEAGPGELSVTIEGEGVHGDTNNVEPHISKLDEFHYDVAYQPPAVGNYWITVKWGNIEIPNSPFCIPCHRPLDHSQFSIEETVTQTYLGKPAQIRVDCNELIEEEDKLVISVHSLEDERHQGEVVRDGDQSYTCTIAPPSLGKYQVYILWDDKHIQHSPFDIENVPVPDGGQFAIEAAEAEREVIAMKVYGPKYAFRYGNLSASVKNTRTGDETPVTIVKNGYKESTVQFKPAHGQGDQVVQIMYDDHNIQGSPFTLVSTDASQCYAKGKGIHKASTNKWNKFAVFTENGGPGELRVEIEGKAIKEGEEEESISLEPLVTAASETRYDVSYSPSVAGTYKIAVYWDIHQIPGSPFTVFCCDPGRYTIPKPPKDGIIGKPIKIAIEEASAPPDEESLEIYAMSKEREEHRGEIQRGTDGSCIASVQLPELGKYVIHVRCNGYEIQDSPFKTKVMPIPIAENVAVSGPGLEDGKVGQPSNFIIDVSKAGHGYMSFQVQGPKNRFKINLERDADNKALIKAAYNPSHPGTYIVAVLWSGVHIPNSPFTIKVDEAEPEILTYEPEEQTAAG